MSTLHDALGGMRDIPQWFLWELTWNEAKAKYDKRPAGGVDASLSTSWMSYEAARAALRYGYALGFWLSADSGYWFLDLDACITADGELLPFAQQMTRALPGVLMEYSSSGRGIHLIGRGPVPANHRTRPLKEVRAGLAPLDMEFYHEQRGIAFGLNGEAEGSADTTYDMAALCAAYFPPRVEIGEGEFDKPRADWRGPDDDDVLIDRALNARSGAGVVFGGKASFAQLWRGEVELNSEHDMALASHLAFWTGCDAPRIERLMWRSGLVREKWREHRTYLRDLTIGRACATCERVYQEPERNLVVRGALLGPPPPPMTTPGATTIVDGALVDPAVMALRDKLLDQLGAIGTEIDFYNQFVPACVGAGLPKAFHESIVRAAQRKLEFWDAKLPIGELRALLFPPAALDSYVAPEWVGMHCYVKDDDKFFNVVNGSRLTAQGFAAEFGRLMPVAEGGRRHNPVEWSLNRWGMVTVHKIDYRPDQPMYFQWDGLDYVNKYMPSSVPESATSWTDEGVAGIEAFKSLLWDMCDRREDVYGQILMWMARNVQQPGRIIGWSPLVKGTQGDGKSILGVMLRSAMGYRNVGVTSNNVLTNTGGFTDWAHGYAVNVIEEMMVVGLHRHQLYNAMKEFVTNEICGQNAKGEKSKQFYNTTNHLCLSNHNNALPLERDDRRFMVIFTPWGSLDEMRTYCGMDVTAWEARFAAIDYAMRNCAGELRAWFLSIDTSTLRGRASAPWTPERDSMIATSKDDTEGTIELLIEETAYGVTPEVFSSSCLRNLLRIRSLHEGVDQLKTSAWNYMLTRAGYSQLPKPVKFDGKTHRVWVRNGFKGDPVTALNTTKSKT